MALPEQIGDVVAEALFEQESSDAAHSILDECIHDEADGQHQMAPPPALLVAPWGGEEMLLLLSVGSALGAHAAACLLPVA